MREALVRRQGGVKCIHAETKKMSFHKYCSRVSLLSDWGGTICSEILALVSIGIHDTDHHNDGHTDDDRHASNHHFVRERFVGDVAEENRPRMCVLVFFLFRFDAFLASGGMSSERGRSLAIERV